MASVNLLSLLYTIFAILGIFLIRAARENHFKSITRLGAFFYFSLSLYTAIVYFLTSSTYVYDSNIDFLIYNMFFSLTILMKTFFSVTLMSKVLASATTLLH